MSYSNVRDDDEDVFEFNMASPYDAPILEEDNERCAGCEGFGRIITNHLPSPNTPAFDLWADCGDCNGTGKRVHTN